MPHITDHHLKNVFLLIIIFLVLAYFLSLFVSLAKINARETKTPQDVARAAGKFVQIDSANVYYEYYRAPQQPARATLVMIHGFGLNLRTWDNQVEYLQNLGYDLVLVDLLGSGLSQDIADSDLRAEAQTQMLSQLMKYLAIPQAIFVGHSHGGSVVQRFALNFPNKVQGLILINSADLSGVLGYQSLIGLNQPYLLQIPVGILVSKENLRSLFTSNGGFADASKVSEALIDKYYVSYTIKGSTRNLVSQFLLSDPNRLVETGHITQPTLVIHSTQDTVLATENTKNILLGLPHREYAEISDAGHGPQDETPAELNQIMGAWLQSTFK